MEIVGAIVEPVVNYISGFIGRQLRYLFFYKSNIKVLEEKLKDLQNIRERVQSVVDEQRGNSYEIYNDVLTWLDKVNDELLDMPQQNEGSCFNSVQWHRLARKTNKRVVEQIPKLIEDGEKFNKGDVGRPAPLPDTKCPTLPANYQILKTRTLLAEQIKDALADPNVNKVGVCGMGGVGKSTLLREVEKLVRQSNLFDLVVIVLVGQSGDAIKVQNEIAGMLNMKLDEKDSQKVRASRLRTKIVEMKDNILIMLDDLWNKYDLESGVGIPCHSESIKKGCKIVMASRSQDLLTNQMNTDKLFKVDSLNEEESWKFFMKIVGEFVESGLEKIAKNVVKSCGGLPIALETLAKTLKKGKNERRWKAVLKKLKNPVSVDIPDVSNHLYTCLKISYDSMDNDEAKSIFLLCSVFPDDHEISVKDLQMYSMGMGLLKNDINNWEDAKDRVMKLVEDLKSSYLLLESEKGDDYVQMHDVVHRVAKYIASEIDHRMSSLTYGYGQSEWLEDNRRGSYDAIFVDCNNFPNLSLKLEFPNLQLLILRNKVHMRKHQISDAFFQGMENLRVLDITVMRFEPSSTHSLKNLQTLCMSYCECNSIDIIGQLKKLKILRIINCSTIVEIPKSMSQLTELKVLEVSYCWDLKVIHPNIISSMTKLEELSLWMWFKGWGEEVSYKNKLIKNAKLSELNRLTRLSNLKLEIWNVEMLSNELSLERAQKLEEFVISVGNHGHMISPDDGYARSLGLDIKSKIDSIGGVVEVLLQRCENLYVHNSECFMKALLRQNGNYCYPHLKHLYVHIYDHHMPRRIGNITPLFDAKVSFPELKDLMIGGEHYLEMLWHKNGLIANSFCKLQNILIEGCKKLTCVFPSHVVTSLVFLNTLKVRRCELLERIFEIEELIHDVKVVRLITLELRKLPNLKYVWNNDPGELLIFPNLKEVEVRDCPQLKSLFPSSFLKHMKEIESLSTTVENEIFAKDEASKLESSEITVLFPSLRKLEIHCKVVEKRSFWLRTESFPKLQRLELFGSKDDGMVTLPLELSEILYKIEDLEVGVAYQLVRVFKESKQNNQNHAKLKYLHLYSLPNLTHVWEDKIQIPPNCFDSLEHIRVSLCGNLKCILPSSMTFFNLTSLEVRCCNGVMNLFSSSVAKSLVNLSRMEIYNCEGMACIVIAEENGEEIIFKRMKELRMHDLPRLASFHSRKCTLEFPSLVYLDITGCPEMMTFSHGIISTPKLKFIYIQDARLPVLPAHGVNDIIQNFQKDEIRRTKRIRLTSALPRYLIHDMFMNVKERHRVEDVEE